MNCGLTILKLARDLQQVLSSQDPLTPWHLHSTFMFRSRSCKRFILAFLDICEFQIKYLTTIIHRLEDIFKYHFLGTFLEQCAFQAGREMKKKPPARLQNMEFPFLIQSLSSQFGAVKIHHYPFRFLYVSRQFPYKSACTHYYCSNHHAPYD